MSSLVMPGCTHSRLAPFGSGVFHEGPEEVVCVVRLDPVVLLQKLEVVEEGLRDDSSGERGPHEHGCADGDAGEVLVHGEWGHHHDLVADFHNEQLEGEDEDDDEDEDAVVEEVGEGVEFLAREKAAVEEVEDC